MRSFCTRVVFLILASCCSAHGFAQAALPSRPAWMDEACRSAGTAEADACRSPGRPAGRQDSAAAESPALTIRVYNYARVEPRMLHQGETEAAGIFRRAGVETEWVNCRIQGVPGESGCWTTFGSTDLLLRMVPSSMADSMAEHLGLGREVLGFALGSREGYGGFVASVFFDRIENLTAKGGIPESHLLAVVSAHELGHLLLPSAGHAAEGIMRGQWNYDDLRPVRSGYLLFRPEQQKLMKDNVLCRMGRITPSHDASSARLADRQPPATPDPVPSQERSLLAPLP